MGYHIGQQRIITIVIIILMFNLYNTFSMLYIHIYISPLYICIIYLYVYVFYTYIFYKIPSAKITNNALVLIATMHYFFFSLLSVMEYF